LSEAERAQASLAKVAAAAAAKGAAVTESEAQVLRNQLKVRRRTGRKSIKGKSPQRRLSLPFPASAGGFLHKRLLQPAGNTI